LDTSAALVLAGRHQTAVPVAVFHAQVTAAVLVFRALTYGLQLPHGALAYFIWQRPPEELAKSVTARTPCGRRACARGGERISLTRSRFPAPWAMRAWRGSRQELIGGRALKQQFRDVGASRFENIPRSVGRWWSVGCSQKSLTTRNATQLAELPQVKGGYLPQPVRVPYTPSTSWRAYSSAS
jgi:hypothetical protein